jgi:hypothetical protein
MPQTGAVAVQSPLFSGRKTMGGNPREHVKDKGFWDGGTGGHDANGQSGGRTSGFPGMRLPKRTGVRTDIEFPQDETNKKNDSKQ